MSLEFHFLWDLCFQNMNCFFLLKTKIFIDVLLLSKKYQINFVKHLPGLII